MFVHENFSDFSHDIALLRLGKGDDYEYDSLKSIHYNFIPVPQYLNIMISTLTPPRRPNHSFNCMSSTPKTSISEERVDLSIFTPICLPMENQNFVNEEGHVYGKNHKDYTLI